MCGRPFSVMGGGLRLWAVAFVLCAVVVAGGLSVVSCRLLWASCCRSGWWRGWVVVVVVGEKNEAMSQIVTKP